MPVREPCLGFDLARPCPPVASLRLCALGTSARLHRRITALSPSRDHPWPNSGAPSLHFWRSGADRSSTSPCTATVPHDAATFADVHCCYLSGRPYRRFPISRSSPRLAWPGLVPPTFNQINLACRFRPRARALSLSQLRLGCRSLTPPSVPPDAGRDLDRLAPLPISPLNIALPRPRPPPSPLSLPSVSSPFPSTPRAFLDHHHLTLSAAIAIELHHHRPNDSTRGRDPFQHGFILVGRFHLRIATDDLFRSTSFPCLLTHVGPAD